MVWTGGFEPPNLWNPNPALYQIEPRPGMAPPPRLELGTNRLTADCSTIELRWNKVICKELLLPPNGDLG
jgi:hypothetical protein